MMRSALWISFLVLVGSCAAEETLPTDTAAQATEEIKIGPAPGGQCGSNTCGFGTYCCNASCGVCAPFGAACLDVYCATTEEANMSIAEKEDLILVGGGGQQCGYVTCGAKQHCCNASCSRCAPKGVECTQETCD